MFKKLDITKVTDFNQFMLWFSFLIFIDSYLIVVANKNIFDISFEYLKMNLGHIPVMIVVYIFSMAIMSSILQSIIVFLKYLKEIALIKFFDIEFTKLNLSDRMHDSEVLDIATIQNNSVLYNQYVIHKNLIAEIFIQKKIASGLVFLCIINYFISTDNIVSFLKCYELFFENTVVWYVQLLNIVPSILILYIFFIAFEYTEYINYMDVDRKVQQFLKDKNEN